MTCIIYREEEDNGAILQKKKRGFESAMDTKEKSLQLMGTFGIVGEAFKIIFSQAKLLWTITLALILPCVLITLANNLMAPLLLAKILSQEITGEWRLSTVKLMEFLVIELVWAILFYAVLMPSVAAVVYTVASVYRGKQQEYSFTAVVRLVPAVWKHMMITCLWYFIMNLIILVAFAFVLSVLRMGSFVFSTWYWIAFHVVGIIVYVLLLCVSMYMAMVWQVATVVSVIEKGYYGLEAMKKSRHLIHGKRIIAWVLTVSYMVIVGLFTYAAYMGYLLNLGLEAKMVYGTVYLVLACVTTLMWELTQSVLYFVCKSHHGESVDEGCSLKGYPEKSNDNKDWPKLEL